MSAKLLRSLRAYWTASQPLAPMPIIVGCGRSGTTLLRFMLDSHPELAIPPETGFLRIKPESLGDDAERRTAFVRAVTQYPPEMPGWDDFGIAKDEFANAIQQLEPFTLADGFRTFYRLYAARCAKPRWGDKTPVYTADLAHVAKLLPEARFIHLIRDGRDVALSLRNVWFCPSQSMTKLAAHWVRQVTVARQAGLGSDRYCEVHYEQLVKDPAAVLAEICRFIDLRYDPAMLSFYQRTPERLQEHRDRYRTDGTLVVAHSERVQQQRRTMTATDSSRAGNWRREMSTVEVSEFESVAGDLLCELGYSIGRAELTNVKLPSTSQREAA